MSLRGGVASGGRVTQGRPLSIWCPSVDISDGGSLRLGWRHGQGCGLMAALEDAEIPALLSVSTTVKCAAWRSCGWAPFRDIVSTYSVPQRYLLVSRGCVYMCMSPLQMYSKNWASTSAPVNKWSVSSTPVRCRAPVDVLLGCRALAAAMVDANEKSKPILNQWIGMSLFMTGPRQIRDLFLCASVCALVCVCVCVLVGDKKRGMTVMNECQNGSVTLPRSMMPSRQWSSLLLSQSAKKTLTPRMIVAAHKCLHEHATGKRSAFVHTVKKRNASKSLARLSPLICHNQSNSLFACL